MTLAAALGLLQGGNLEAAERLCKKLLKRHPGDPQIQHLMGLVLLHSARPADAHGLLNKAAKRQPDNPDCHYNLAECRRALGKPDAAITGYERVLALRPGDGRALTGMAEARMAQGRPGEAEASFRAAVAARPETAAAWNGLGLALREQGRLDEAVDCWRRARALDGGLAVVHSNLGLGLHGLGRIDEAAAALVRALELEPDNHAIRLNFAACLKNRSVETLNPGLKRCIEACFDDPEIDAQSLLPAALGVLEAGDEGDGLICDPLFLRLLETTFMAYPDWEDRLSRLRAALLAAPDEQPRRLLFAMAQQCFNNEYLFAVMDDEQAMVRGLAADLESRLAAGALEPTEGLEKDLARLALYRPLHDLAGAERLPEGGWSDGFRRLLESQLKAPLKEAEIRASIPSMGAINDTVSAAVKQMYEENPYPRWMTVAGRRAEPLDRVLRGLFPHFRAPDSLFGALDMLAAGCGTGRQAIILATRFADCRVLAMDLSFNSLAYAKRMAAELKVGNIDFRQGDILGLGDLDRRFHLIESVGVLHHLADPLAGWRLLSNLLRPGGLMKIGLYSATARRHVAAARDFVAAQGYPPTPEGIRRCRRDIAALPVDRIERKVMDNRDFYSMSSCRDLLFHVQEHRFTLGEIDAMLQELGLRFIGFELSQIEAVAAYRAAYPDDVDMTDLGHWDRFEADNPDLFMALYQFWCQKT